MLFTVSCSRHPRVTVVNESADPLTNLVLSGSDFSESPGSLAPGGQTTVGVTPSADTWLALTFEAKGTTHAPPADGYFEASGRYRVKATLRPDFSVKVESELRRRRLPIGKALKIIGHSPGECERVGSRIEVESFLLWLGRDEDQRPAARKAAGITSQTSPPPSAAEL